MSSDAARTALVERLRAEHARMLDTMRCAREALVRGNVLAARDELAALAALHAPHAAVEESELFGALPPGARWPLRTYEAEHAHALRMLAQLRQRLDAVPARLRSARQRLELVDAALPLQHVLEHHFEREEKGLFVEVG